MTKEELQKIIEHGESNLVELKEARDGFEYKRVGKYFSALSNEANLNGQEEAYLIFGVNDKKEYKGTNFKLNDLRRSIRRDCNRDFKSIKEFSINGERILCFIIPKSQGLATFKDIAYGRDGASLSVLSQEKIKILLLNTDGGLELSIVKKCKNMKEVLTFLDISTLELKSQKEEEVKDNLIRKKIIKKTQKSLSITFIGALLFAKNLLDFELGNRAIRFIHYDGNKKTDNVIKDVIEEEGYAIVYERLLKTIEGIIPINEVLQSGIRKNIPLFPVQIYRELIANALVHQDFSLNPIYPTISLYKNRMEFFNIGKPLIRTERFIDLEETRNSNLVKLTRDIGIVEERGVGIDRVIEECEVLQLPAPNFIENTIRTTVTLYAPKEFSIMNKNDKIRACWQHCYLKYCLSEEVMTNSSLRERFKLEKNNSNIAIVSKIIKDTLGEGKIKNKGDQSYIPNWA